MKAITAIGIVVAMGAVLGAAILEGTSPIALFNVPALVLVTGGTLGCVMASTNFQAFMAMPKLMILTFKGADHDPAHAIEELVGFAEKARREGLLALEGDVRELDDKLMQKGLQLVVDGTDSELVRGILESEIDGTQQRHGHNAHMFAGAAGFAPTIGIIGTVMGLVHVLENLAAPETLGPMIAGAFLATLYGVGSANLIFLPIANKLKEMSAEEINVAYMVLEGVLSIQAGDNPRVLQEKLETYVSPGRRGAAADDTAGGVEEAKAA